MDKNLDFLIPRSDIDKVNIVEMLNEWERKMFSQEPKKYSFLSNVFFHEQTNMEYYKGMVEDELDINQYIALCLEGDSLSELEFMVNQGKYCKKIHNELINFIYELFRSLNLFYIILSLDDEGIDYKYVFSNADEAIQVLLNSLDWNSPKGIVISPKYRKKSDKNEPTN